MMDPRSVDTHITQQLRKLISSVPDRTFGDTPGGIDWCIKALHPSDPMTEVRGIPDYSAVPTLCMNYQSTATLTIAPGQATPWAWDMTLLPHPIFFAYWDGEKAYDPGFNITGEGNFQNTQLAPTSTDPSQLCLIWKALAKRWRLCYQSVTVIQDGPDLANQGTIAVSQSTFEPRLLTTGQAIQPDGSSKQLGMFYPAAYYDKATEGPNFERAQAMPNAMMGRSKDGAYVPLKLTETVQRWQSERDFVMPCNRGNEHPHPAEGWVDAPTTFSPAYPFTRITPFYGNTSAVYGDFTPGLMNGNVAHICARNLSDQTSFTFHFRMGVEIQLDPSSTLTPQLKLSPPYDARALDMYFRVARELKDAYPADYNLTGKLWKAISDAVKTIIPPLFTATGIAPFAPVALQAFDAAEQTGRLIKQRRTQRRQGNQPRKARVPQQAKLVSNVAQHVAEVRAAEVAGGPGTEPSAAQLEAVREERRAANTPRRVSFNRTFKQA